MTTEQVIKTTQQNTEKKIFVVDSQKLGTGQACMRQYQYSFDWNIEPINKEEPLERGDLMHIMLKAYYKMRAHRDNWDRNNKTHRDVVTACVRVGRHAAVRMGIDVTEVEFVIRAFMEYAEFVEHDGWDNHIIKAVEDVGTKVLYEDENFIFLYETKMDLIIELPGQQIIAVDHKTAKQRKQYPLLSNQFMGYCWHLGNNNIIVNVIGFQKTLKPNERFTRQMLSYPDELISRWRQNSIVWIKQMIYQIEHDDFPQNFTSCDKFSGCKFRDLCESPSEVFAHKLNTLYKIKEHWDVGAVHDAKGEDA